MDSKRCGRCKQTLPASEFYRKTRIRSRTDNSAYCKPCARFVSKEAMWRKALRGYGLTPESYWALLADQGGVCAICGGVNLTDRRLPVDHCHTTGIVRGILCTSCNRAIGWMNDDPKRLRVAAAYLEAAR